MREWGLRLTPSFLELGVVLWKISSQTSVYVNLRQVAGQWQITLCRSTCPLLAPVFIVSPPTFPLPEDLSLWFKSHRALVQPWHFGFYYALILFYLRKECIMERYLTVFPSVQMFQFRSYVKRLFFSNLVRKVCNKICRMNLISYWSNIYFTHSSNIGIFYRLSL